MNADHDIMQESRIHDLLAGRLAEWDRADLLRLIGRDDNARRLMLDMLTLQDQARQSVGLNVEPEAMQTYMARTLEALKGRAESTVTGAGLPSDSPVPSRPVRWFDWGVRIAALLLLGVCGWLAYMLTVAASRPVGQPPLAHEVVAHNGGVAMPALNVDDLATLRKIWDQVRQTGDAARPWVLLSNGVGEFGYLPAGGTENEKTGLILVRCVIVGDGKPVTQIYFLLSGQQPAELLVPGGGRLGGQPLDVALVSSGNQVHVDLKACETTGIQAGLRGTAVQGRAAVDAGQFRFEGQMFRVLLQATPLAG